MTVHDSLQAVLAAMHEATLDDALWPRASNLIDAACGATGNGLIVGQGHGDDSRILFARSYRRGERNEALQQHYFQNYYPIDERIPRIRELPDGLVVHVPDLYTDQEKKTSPAYNEGLPCIGSRNGLAVRLDGPQDTRIVWAIADPRGRDGWGSVQLARIRYLLPHVRHYMAVRQAMAAARAMGTSLGALLDNTRLGIIHLGQDARIIEANDRALMLLRQPYGLFDQGGFLTTWLPRDSARLQELLAAALPPPGRAGAAGSMSVRRSDGLQRLALHVRPVGSRETDFGARRVRALVLLVEPDSEPILDRDAVAEVLGLTAAESEVAVMLSEGRTVREIAKASSRRVGTVHLLLKRAYGKLGVSRQVELVRLVLSLGSMVRPRR